MIYIKEYSWLSVTFLPHTSKTHILEVKSKDGAPLGLVKWFGRWRKYSFFPCADTVFEQDCLRDIAEIIEFLTKDHAEELKQLKQKK